jgi:AcrR family transcriptional regulator
MVNDVGRLPQPEKLMRDSATAQALQAACEELLLGASHPDDVTVRAIASRAGAGVGAINYHFGSLEQLIFLVGERTYLRLNAERLSLLHKAVERAAPEPAPAGDLIIALIGPSIRWSLDPRSGYQVLRHMTTIAQASQHPEIFQPIVEDIEHHRVFIAHFRKVAPWLSDVEIGFRISCLLGVRSQMTRSRDRTDVLTDHALDLNDPEVIIAQVVAATEPMFTTAPRQGSNSVPNPSRR